MAARTRTDLTSGSTDASVWGVAKNGWVRAPELEMSSSDAGSSTGQGIVG